MAVKFLIYFTGFFVRLWLFRMGFAEWISERNESVSPLTSWKRVTEGLSLIQSRISPYSGDICHETPLMLQMLKGITEWFKQDMHIFFIICDIIMAVILDRIAVHLGSYLLAYQKQNVKKYSVDATKIILTSNQMRSTQLGVVSCYLFNPFTISTCLAMSSGIFNNMALSLTVLFTLKGNRMLACFFLAVSSYLSLYPVMLVVPVAIYLAQHESKESGLSSPLALASITQTVLCSASASAVLLYTSFMLEGSWQFLHSTYGFILTVTDLMPNVGVFWYFFTEMFEHFRPFFICVFQINVFIYTVPLSIKLKNHPIFLMYILISIMCVFKSYPSYADAALYTSMLPLWKHVFSYLRNGFIVSCMLLCCGIMAPIMWHLWIYAGSANANFYFAITLVFSTAQVFLITDLLFAYLRREYDLIHGVKPKLIDGKPVPIVLD